MRHAKKINHLGRKSAHRKAMLANMAISLIEHKRIKTTLAKAKALRIYVEPIINRTKEDTTHSRRMVFRKLQNKQAVTELFREIAQKVAERQGGYTRILKTGNRLGDNAEMCIIELVDFNQTYFSDNSTKAVKKRTRRGKAKQKETQVEEVQKSKDVKKPVTEDTVKSDKEIENTEVENTDEEKDAE
jgi:large subunit ribosomal protein L17